MKVVTVVGARPQFIKAAAVSRAIADYNTNSGNVSIQEVIVHTGQHFDRNMSDVFFTEMGIPKADHMLDINSLSHGAMTGRMLEEIERILLDEQPDQVLVYGDTNSTLAAALAAAKLNISVVHVEAGLRSFNMRMPEEINRILTDRVSALLCCPSGQAMRNLEKEGFGDLGGKMVNVGDVMFDTVLLFSPLAKKPGLDIPDRFALATVHRAENTDDLTRLSSIISALNSISEKIPVLLPLHPRTRSVFEKERITLSSRITCLDPIGYLEMLYLLNHCELVLTDSGGLQKEAFFCKRPCITLRDETEWIELVKLGVNVLAGASHVHILKAFECIRMEGMDFTAEPYGDGGAAGRIVAEMMSIHVKLPLPKWQSRTE